MDYHPGNSNLIGTTNRAGKKFYRYVLPNQWHLEVDKNGVIFSLTGEHFPNYSENVEHTRKAIGWEEYIGPHGNRKAIARNFM